jgi:aspartyl-tRNA(Asn)/glutamyl-tRNA(Gln) amidotransferase subunit A
MGTPTGQALHELTLHELQDGLARRAFSAVELIRAIYTRIEMVEPAVHAFVALTRERAEAAAVRADEALKAGGAVPPLTGIPVGIKDNLCTTGVETTCASKILKGFVPPYNATVVERLDRSGMVMIGKTNMDEFAMGSSTENSSVAVTANPWDTTRIPGGSSGGSAAAVAAGCAAAALGSDTGGSIRQPAALCGLVGFKPTYGRVSRYGLIAFASSLDQIGPLTKDVTDCAILLQAIAGHDPRDSTSASIDVPDYRAALREPVAGLQLGVPKEYFVEGMDPEVERAVREAIRVYEKMGFTVREISLPNTRYAVATYYLVATAEASSNLARYDGVKYGFRTEGAKTLAEMYARSRAEGFGPEVKRRIMLGTYALSAGYYNAYYQKAQQVRTLLRRDFDRAFADVDVIVTPTTPTPAFRIGEKADDPLQMYLSDIFTISVNLAGIPALSMPCGLTQAGLPVGLQLLGKPFDEATLLRAAYAYEQATEWHKKRAVVK